ncbi:MAG: ABC transporter ATP-binding protein [Erysipelotrichales bacterium]|nr:ABC transporter ATP-binding protein [Erysipelotrichales bacterium]
MEDTIIEVKNLYKTFGEVKAVQDLSFSVKRGSLFAFLGQNGAGKTTTVRIICSLLKKDSGSVIIDGINIENNIEAIKKKIGVVFQGSILDDYLTVYDNLLCKSALYGFSTKEIKDRIAELDKIFTLNDIIKRPYGKLSGGQKRRTDIARALLHKPLILFLDEPTTGLDPATRKSVWEAIIALKEKGITIFLTTHYMEEVNAADQVLILSKGQIAASGTPYELKEKYTNISVSFITPETDENREFFEKDNLKFSYNNGAYRINAKSAEEAYSYLTKYRQKYPDFEVLKGDMDDVFLAVTGEVLNG